MINQVGDLTLNNLTIDNKIMPSIDGLLIKKHFQTDMTDIAYILWDEQNEYCYIKTIANNFQDCIVSYTDFQNFVQLVDEAYLIVTLLNKPELEGKI